MDGVSDAEGSLQGLVDEQRVVRAAQGRGPADGQARGEVAEVRGRGRVRPYGLVVQLGALLQVREERLVSAIVLPPSRAERNQDTVADWLARYEVPRREIPRARHTPECWEALGDLAGCGGCRVVRRKFGGHW
jgi:hypothetical protein